VDIDFVVNTHAHYDHSSLNYLFRHAPIIGYGCKWYKQACHVYTDDRYVLAPTVMFIPTPGHTAEHVSVRVNTRDKRYVIAGEDPGSKYEKAKKLGVKILHEKEFLKMIT